MNNYVLPTHRLSGSNPKLRDAGTTFKSTLSGGVHTPHYNIDSNPTPVVQDTNNSTTDTLSASGTYTGTATDVSGYVQVHLTSYAEPNVTPNGDANTAQGSLYAEFSPDGTNWDISIPIVVRNGLFIPQTYVVVLPWFRVRYLNDGGAAAISSLGLTETADTARNQTAFRLNTYLLRIGTKDLGRTIDQSVDGSNPVALNRAILMAKRPDATFGNIAGTDQDELLTSSAEANIGALVVHDNASIAADEYEILVDLSDTTNFPHSETGYIVVTRIKLALELASNSTGVMKIGVITRIDGTDADLDFFFVAPFLCLVLGGFFQSTTSPPIGESWT